MSRPAQALPSFARQTGQPCGTCHTDFPGLTPYGRLFKLNGYTAGGGPFRKTLFPSQDDATKALAAYNKKFGTGKDSDAAKTGQSDTSNIWVPPISMMAIVGYTHTEVSQPFSSPYKPNDNVVVAPLSFFYGGAITEHIGAFAQVTYNNAAFGGSDPNNFTNGFNQDPCGGCQWSWDNIDVRYANTAKLGNIDVIYGISANNNPSVQDPWNTTPAWGFPYSGSTIAPGPFAATLVDGTYAGYVGGIGGYAFINNLVYLELTGYRTLDFKTLPKLGLDPFGASPFHWSPYWRVAIEPHWGNHWFEFGTFSPIFRVHGTRTTDQNELWSYGPEAQKILTNFDRLRYRMMPYIYSVAWKVTNESYTPMRPLVMDFRTDTNVFGIKDQFLFGPALMPCPVTSSGVSASVRNTVSINTRLFRLRPTFPISGSG